MSRARLPWRFAAVGASLAIAWVLVLWFLALDPTGQPPLPPLPATVTYYDRHGSLLYESLDPELGTGSQIPLRDLPSYLIQATIATEDASFYSNPGVDLLALIRAAIQNLGSSDIVSGGSTITQQLARNLYMTPEERSQRSVWRKLREAGLALRLGTRLSKDQLLEWYLNTAPYGHQTTGVDAAARVYFGKRARDLDLAECALLAGLPQAPSAYDPFLDLPSALIRQHVVLNLMVRQGYLTQVEADSAAAEDLKLAKAAFPIKAPHFVAYAQELLSHQLGLRPEDHGGLRVHTTLDLGLQETAEAIVWRQVSALADHSVTDGALVALDPGSGEILSMVGSSDYFDRTISGQVNVTISPRQPGSSIKPILYAAALEHGFTPASVLYDVPTSFLTADGKSYAPENYDRTWHGPVSLRDALANSLNLPTVALMQRVGVGSFLELASRAGLTTIASKGAGDLSLALGSGEVRLLDLVSTYSAFATSGIAREPIAIRSVEDGRGNVLYHASQPRLHTTTSAQVAYLMTDILSDNDARTPSFGDASPLRLTRPSAAKTGTTTDWRDNWTVGYTPDLAAGVWVGNADNTPMRAVSGIAGAAPIWHDFMEEALKGLSPRPFEQPEGLIRRDVCVISGELPSDWCPDRRSELFVAGTEPTTICDWHKSFAVDRVTGALAGPNTPPSTVEQRVFLVAPPELQTWARERGIPQPPKVSGGQVGESPPRLLLTSPANGAVYRIVGDLPLELQLLELSVAGGGMADVARIDITVDGALISSFSGPPYRYLWQLASGRHRVEATAFDRAGRVLASDSADIVVEAAPNGP